MQAQSAFEPGLASPDGRGAPSRARGAGHVGAGDREPAVGAVALAKPPVRKLAKDLGVDLTAVDADRPERHGHPRGRRGRRRPRRRPAGAPRRPRPAAVAPGERETARADQGRAQDDGGRDGAVGVHRPHVTEWVTIDATRTMEFVDRLKKRREFRDVKVSPLLVLARAVMLAMRRTPEINSFWDEAAQEVVYKHYVNLGIAAATPARAGRPERQGRPGPVAARPRGRAQRADRDGPRRAGPSRPR